MKKCRLACVFILLASGTMAWAQSDYVIQSSPSLAAVNLPTGLADRLEPQGSRLVYAPSTNGAKNPICDVWWVKSVPLAGKLAGSSPDVLYRGLQTGTLMGLLQFLSPNAEDSHDQKLKRGFYTMRYAQMPQDSSHAGVSQYRDFVLLSPLSADTQLDQVLGLNDLVKLSSKASGTAHPAVMNLVPANPAYKQLPAVVADDLGNCSLQVKLRETSATGEQEVAMAILLVTPPKEEGGS